MATTLHAVLVSLGLFELCVFVSVCVIERRERAPVLKRVLRVQWSTTY